MILPPPPPPKSKVPAPPYSNVILKKDGTIDKRCGAYGQKRGLAKPIIFETPEDVLDMFAAYVEDVTGEPIQENLVFSARDGIRKTTIDKARPLTIRGFCIFGGFSHRAFNKWAADREDLKDALEFVKDYCFTNCFEGAAVGIFNPSLVARYLGLADKVDVSNGAENVAIIEIEPQVDTANLYHPDDKDCAGPLYTQSQLECGIAWTPPKGNENED